MKRAALVLTLGLVLLTATKWTAAQQSAAGAQAANPLRFTGTSTSMDGKDLTVARRRFEPGARTYWHSHEKGQLLMVEDGRMRVQKRGDPMKELGVGQSDYTGPNIAHWHGASPDRTLIQINIGFGGAAKWFDAVTDDEYAGKPRR